MFDVFFGLLSFAFSFSFIFDMMCDLSRFRSIILLKHDVNKQMMEMRYPQAGKCNVWDEYLGFDLFMCICSFMYIVVE